VKRARSLSEDKLRFISTTYGFIVGRGPNYGLIRLSRRALAVRPCAERSTIITLTENTCVMALGSALVSEQWHISQEWRAQEHF
jgi:hypothetical protein